MDGGSLSTCFKLQPSSLLALMVKNPPAMREIWVGSLDREEPPEKAMATHSSILAWRIPWTGAWRSTIHGVERVGHCRPITLSLFTFLFLASFFSMARSPFDTVYFS